MYFCIRKYALLQLSLVVGFYRVVQKTDTQFYFWDNFSNSAQILTIFFTVTSRNLCRVNVKFFCPPHLYCVTTLPSKTNTVQVDTAAGWSASAHRPDHDGLAEKRPHQLH